MQADQSPRHPQPRAAPSTGSLGRVGGSSHVWGIQALLPSAQLISSALDSATASTPVSSHSNQRCLTKLKLDQDTSSFKTLLVPGAHCTWKECQTPPSGSALRAPCLPLPHILSWLISVQSHDDAPALPVLEALCPLRASTHAPPSTWKALSPSSELTASTMAWFKWHSLPDSSPQPRG